MAHKKNKKPIKSQKIMQYVKRVGRGGLIITSYRIREPWGVRKGDSLLVLSHYKIIGSRLRCQGGKRILQRQCIPSLFKSLSTTLIRPPYYEKPGRFTWLFVIWVRTELYARSVADSLRYAHCKSLYDQVTLSFPQAMLVTLCALIARERRLKNELRVYLVQSWQDQKRVLCSQRICYGVKKGRFCL